ncbi:hypothetical protein L1887_63001 [Cichorium endivia]|nr:hypothetical protein L1887_63001 [Cichorium endivia]
MRQTALEGRIRSGADYTGGDVGDDPQKMADELFAQVQASLVGGEELDFDYYTIGTRPDPRDGLPILGPVEGLKGITIAVMHSGVTNAAIVVGVSTFLAFSLLVFPMPLPVVDGDFSKPDTVTNPHYCASSRPTHGWQHLCTAASD